MQEMERRAKMCIRDSFTLGDGLGFGDPFFQHADDAGSQKAGNVNILHAAVRDDIQSALLQDVYKRQ